MYGVMQDLHHSQYVESRCSRCPEAAEHKDPEVDPQVASITACNYFNTNHAHVLRTLHFPSIVGASELCAPTRFELKLSKVVPPVYPYLPGKEYLHGWGLNSRRMLASTTGSGT